MSEPTPGPQGRARGGIARAQRLTAEERTAIAKKAAAARWRDDVAEVVCGSPDRPLVIGGIEIECYVLADGTRVITQPTLLRALGRHPRAPGGWQEGEIEQLPAILQGKALSPFISKEMLSKSKPIRFRVPGRGGSPPFGYNAELLPEICEAYLKAREEDELPHNQLHVAQQAEILVRGLARVGIIALIDEATGYQEVRAREALAKILEAFVAKELQPWIRTFPDDYYREMFRLRGLEYPGGTVKRPQYFGVLTNDIVYGRLAPKVLEELKRVTERTGSGRPRHRYFQRLTNDQGYPKLREHLGSVVTLMKLSRSWSDFMRKLEQIHPRFGDTIPMPLDFDEGSGF